MKDLTVAAVETHPWHFTRWRRAMRKTLTFEGEFHRLKDEQLAERTLGLRRRAVLSDKSLSSMLPEAFALVCESIRRRLGLRPYPVQLLGAIAMHHGFIIEMQTGEGKTLTAILTAYLNALSNKGVHIVTANDYLARRDAEWTRPVFESLGLTVGHVESQMPKAERSRAYSSSITYGTAKEMGFDFLRDRLTVRRHWQGLPERIAYSCRDATREPDRALVQRQPHSAIVDEADNVLIDEAQSPLIISGIEQEYPTDDACYRWCADACTKLSEGTHFQYDADQKTAGLTAEGKQFVASLPKPRELIAIRSTEIVEAVERAVRVSRGFIRDRHYVVRDGAVVVVDEFTGRLGIGRQWRNGVHQAVEAKEGLKITRENTPQAHITLQQFFARYPRLAGMTGTIESSRREIRSAYGLSVVSIPTNRPCIRRQLPDKTVITEDEKWLAVVEEVRGMISKGRPVLIGTRSIEKSERLSEILRRAGIEHKVLNAKQNADEARIIAQAGRLGRVTLATNMAGRGTDIRIDDEVARLGGLHVICTELHESRRIDRQLAGRAARQGDPGSVRQFLSFQDEILDAGFGAEKAKQMRCIACRNPTRRDRRGKLFRDAQNRVERERFRARQSLRHHANHRSEQLKQWGLDPYLAFELFPI